MKKFIQSLILTLMISGIFIQSKASAADWGAGLYSYYAWWKPSFSELYDNYKMGPGLYIGPMLNISFSEKWSFGIGIYLPLILNSELEYDYNGTGESSGSPYTIHIESEAERLDLDTSLTYRINNNFKVFAGYKYSEFNDSDGASIKDDKITLTAGFTKSGTWERNVLISHGPGLGLSYTIPFAEKAAMTFGTSIIYMRSSFDTNEYVESSSNTVSAEKVKYSYNGFGNNSTLSMSYFIEPMSTAVSIGGRFQVLKYFGTGDAPSLGNDYFYGITASAMYLF